MPLSHELPHHPLLLLSSHRSLEISGLLEWHARISSPAHELRTDAFLNVLDFRILLIDASFFPLCHAFRRAFLPALPTLWQSDLLRLAFGWLRLHLLSFHRRCAGLKVLTSCLSTHLTHPSLGQHAAEPFAAVPSRNSFHLFSSSETSRLSSFASFLAFRAPRSDMAQHVESLA